MHKRRLIWIAVIGLSLLLYGLVVAWVGLAYRDFKRAHAGEPDMPGVSFSILYAKELGIDWQAAYLAMLHDLQIKHFRLMSYWETIEAKPGEYQFADLDYQMQQAVQAGAQVSLAIGLRQPRWPECHQPDWAANLSGPEKQAALDNFITRVVERYRGSPALASYQLENEALNTVFGTCSDFSRDRLKHEFDLVKQLDSSHPIIVSVSNEYGVPLGQPRGDKVGFSIYRRVWDSTITKGYISYPFPAWYFGLKAAIIEKLIHRPVMIHELQTEPWGPKPTVQMTIPEQNQSMDADKVLASAKYAQKTGIREYYLWGGEWWYWRMTNFNDSSLWSAAKQIYSSAD